jgi:arsenate reductase (thioredoxin)
VWRTARRGSWRGGGLHRRCVLVHIVYVVGEVMREAGIDVSSARPQKLTEELASNAAMLVTMGCGDECPYVPGVERDDWPLDDPKGRPVEDVRRIRDDIRNRVEQLIRSRGWR